MFGHIDGLCEPTNKQRFTCNGSKVMYNASLIWGTIGPQRMFQSGQVYNGLVYFFIIGVSYPRRNFDRLLTDLLARCDGDCLLHLPALPQQLGSLYQCPDLLQCRWQHSSSQYQYVS